MVRWTQRSFLRRQPLMPRTVASACRARLSRQTSSVLGAAPQQARQDEVRERNSGDADAVARPGRRQAAEPELPGLHRPQYEHAGIRLRRDVAEITLNLFGSGRGHVREFRFGGGEEAHSVARLEDLVAVAVDGVGGQGEGRVGGHLGVRWGRVALVD